MAGMDNGQFDPRALQRAGDFTNDRAEWKRWSFVRKGHVGAASPRQGEITFDGLNDDDNVLDHRLHYLLALVLKGGARHAHESGTRQRSVMLA